MAAIQIGDRIGQGCRVGLGRPAKEKAPETI
jgi:hypothetical protein